MIRPNAHSTAHYDWSKVTKIRTNAQESLVFTEAYLCTCAVTTQASRTKLYDVSWGDACYPVETPGTHFKEKRHDSA